VRRRMKKRQWVNGFKDVLKKNPKISVIIFLVVIVVILLLINRTVSKEEKLIEIKDKCGPFMGRIIHTIKSEDICKMMCRAQCESVDRKYRRIEFIDGGIGCHSCNCYCE
jgi:hypothetical protein